MMQFDFGRHVGTLAVWFFGNFLATDSAFAVNNYAPPYYLNTGMRQVRRHSS